jgi:hypothetical protein
MVSTPAAPGDGAVCAQPAELAQEQGGRTEAGEGRLDKVEADEGGEEQPSGADQEGERDAQQDEDAGEDANKGFGFHGDCVNYMRIHAYA